MKVRIKHLFAIVVCLTMALTFSMQNKVFALDAGWQDGDPLSVRFVYDDNAGSYAGQETMHYTIVRSQQKKFMESQITGSSSFQDTDGAKYTMSGIVWQSNNTSVDYSKYYSYNDLKALSGNSITFFKLKRMCDIFDINCMVTFEDKEGAPNPIGERLTICINNSQVPGQTKIESSDSKDNEEDN